MNRVSKIIKVNTYSYRVYGRENIVIMDIYSSNHKGHYTIITIKENSANYFIMNIKYCGSAFKHVLRIETWFGFPYLNCKLTHK